MAQQGQAGTPSTGTDPAYVPDREVFDAYTHQQIWDLAREPLAPAELRRVGDAWGSAANAVESAFDEHAREISRLSGEWSGIAASAAHGAAAALVRAGDETAAVCRVLQQLSTANADAAETVRAAIPPPPQPYLPDPDPAVEAVTGGPRRTAYNTAAAAATATAQDTMTFVYNPTIPASGDKVPRFPAVDAATETAPVSGLAGAQAAPATPGPEMGPVTRPARETEDPGRPEHTTNPDDGDTATGPTPGTAGMDAPAQDRPHPQGPPEPISVSPGLPTDSPPAGPPTTPAQTPTPPAGPTSNPDGPPANPDGPSAASAPDDGTPGSTSQPAAEPPAGTTPADTTPTPGTTPAGTDPAGRSMPATPSTAPAGSPEIADQAGRSPAGPPITSAPAPTGTAPTPPVPAQSASPVSPAAPILTSPSAPPPGSPSVPAPAAPAPTGSGPANPTTPLSSSPVSSTPPAPTGSVPGSPGPAQPVSPNSPAAPVPTGTAPANPAPVQPVTTTSPTAPVAPAPAGYTHPAAPAGGGPSPGSAPVGSRPVPLLTAGPEISPPADPGPAIPTGTGSAGPEINGSHPARPENNVSGPGTPGITRPGSPNPDREPLGPAGTATEASGSRTDQHEHPGGRPGRLFPAGVPVPTGTAAPPRTPSPERSSPDFLHAPNEDLTAIEPMVPPVLGEYTEAERAERADPGGGSR